MKPVLTIRWWPFWGTDVGGQLVDEKGEVLWGHVSSSTGWLRIDLTDNFTDRRNALEERYPGGYEIRMVQIDPKELERVGDEEDSSCST